MSTVTENDLRELKELINSRFDGLSNELKAVDKKIDERLSSIQHNLDDLKKQSEKQDNRIWLLISGLFLTLLGAVAKIAFFPNP